MTRADGGIDRSSEQKGNCSVARLFACVARLTLPNWGGQDFEQCFFLLIHNQHTLITPRKTTLDKDKEVMPKRNGMATSLGGSTCILTGHISSTCPQSFRCHDNCSCDFLQPQYTGKQQAAGVIWEWFGISEDALGWLIVRFLRQSKLGYLGRMGCSFTERPLRNAYTIYA